MTGVGGSLLKSLVAPPTNYSGTYRASPFIRFGGGTRPGSLRLDYRLKVGTVTLNYATITGIASVSVINSGGTQTQGTHFYCPANVFYYPDPVNTFAKLFSMWKSNGVCYEFVPRVAGGTTSGISLTVGWTEDPVYPDTHSWTNGSGGWQPTEAQVSVLEQAVQFPVWVPQQCIKVDAKKEWLYSTAASFDTRVDLADEPADIRMQYAGILALSGSDNPPGTPGTAAVLGSLYAQGSVEFHELASPINRDPTLSKEKCERKERERKER